MTDVSPIVRGNEVIDDSLDVLNIHCSFLRTLLLDLNQLLSQHPAPASIASE